MTRSSRRASIEEVEVPATALQQRAFQLLDVRV